MMKKSWCKVPKKKVFQYTVQYTGNLIPLHFFIDIGIFSSAKK